MKFVFYMLLFFVVAAAVFALAHSSRYGILIYVRQVDQNCLVRLLLRSVMYMNQRK